MTVEDDRRGKRIFITQEPPPERSPSEMLSILSRQVGRDVERIRVLGKEGRDSLTEELQDFFDATLDRVVKLSRAQKALDGDPETAEIRKRIAKLKDEA